MESEGWSPCSLGSGAHLGAGRPQLWSVLGGGGGTAGTRRQCASRCQACPKALLCPADGNIVPGLPMVTTHVSPGSDHSQNNGPETQGQAAPPPPVGALLPELQPAGWEPAQPPLCSKEARGSDL